MLIVQFVIDGHLHRTFPVAWKLGIVQAQRGKKRKRQQAKHRHLPVILDPDAGRTGRLTEHPGGDAENRPRHAGPQ